MLVSVLSFVYLAEYVAGCGSDGTDSQCLSEDQGICKLFAAIKSKAEAHDVDGFIALVAPDYLHNCMDTSQLRIKLDAFLPTVKRFTYNVTAAATNESQATVSAALTITSNTGEAVINWTEPDTTDNSLGLGYLIKSNEKWLLFGDRRRARPTVQVGYRVPNDPLKSDYCFGFYVTSSCAVLKAAEVTGPNVSVKTLQHDIGSESMSGTIYFSDAPAVGDQYTFSITYDDNSQETLTDSVKAVIDVILSINVTFEQGTAQITWTDVSNQVPNAVSYAVDVIFSNGTSIWASPAYPLTQTSATFDEDNNALQPLISGQQYFFGVTLFDIYENYTTKYKLVSVP
jgi:hypothetical protein